MDRIQLRRDTSANWTTYNPVLMEGEVGYETDTKKRKIGDGTNTWNNLDYLAAENISQELGDSENATISQKGISLVVPYDISKMLTNSDGTNKFTLQEAAYNIPISLRRKGMSVRFVSSNTERYETWVYVGDSDNIPPDFYNDFYWRQIIDSQVLSSTANKVAINGNTITSEFLQKGYWENVNGKVKFTTANPSTPLYSLIVECKAGEVFYVQSIGHGNAKNWFTASKDFTILKSSEAVNDSFIVEIEKDGYLIVNHLLTDEYSLFLLYKVKSIEGDFIEGNIIKPIFYLNDFLQDYYVVSTGNNIRLAKDNVPGRVQCLMIKAPKGTSVYANIYSENLSSPLIALDRNRNILHKEDITSPIYCGNIYKMPEDGYIIINNHYANSGNLTERYVRILPEKSLYTLEDSNQGYFENVENKASNALSNPNLMIRNICIPCSHGDKFRINTFGWEAAKPFFIVDNNRNIMRTGTTVSSEFYEEIEVTEENAAFLLVNYRNFIRAGRPTIERLNNIIVKDKIKYVTCLGDSLTVGYQGNDNTSYPEELGKLLGDNWKIINGGYDGDTIEMILGRQGSNVLLNKNEITLPEGSSNVEIGTLASSNIVSALTPNTSLPLLRFYYADKTRGIVNSLLINNTLCDLSFTGSIYNDSNGKYNLKSIFNLDKSITIPANSVISTALSRVGNNSEVLIIWMGANGFSEGNFTTERLLEYHKIAIDYSNTNNIIIIGLHTLNNNSLEIREEQETVMMKAFGLKYINLRKYMVEQALSDAGLTPTEQDNIAIYNGDCPPQLLYDNIHLNKVGYTLVGNLVYKRGTSLGYW